MSRRRARAEVGGNEEYLGYFWGCPLGPFVSRASKEMRFDSRFTNIVLLCRDDEVKELGAENMRKYWSIAEMRRMPM